LLQQYGVEVPRGILARTDLEVAAAVGELGGSAMIKAQVLTGGRGKAGAIQAVSSQEQAQSVAEEILAMSVKGFDVKHVLITERINICQEYYVAVTIDRGTKSIVLILSAAGGMEIEDIAAKEPDKIQRFELSGAVEKVTPEDLKKWLSMHFRDSALLDQMVEIVRNIYQLFRDKDCSLIEINPLAVTAQNRLVAADAKIVFDDNAIFRQSDIAPLRNLEEYTVDELEAKERGLSFVSLSGQIGCMVNGAGLAMATMDGIKLAGGSAANFLDVGGSSNPQKVLDAMRILLRNKQLKVILVNIFGGITRCDDVAQGIILAREQLGITVPMVIRLVGTNEKKGRDILNEAGLIVARSMTEAISEAVRCEAGGSQL
jgi:succinyl-CoA synthetase beta subunit